MSAVKARFVGTWSLISWERLADGKLLEHPLGPEPVGLITYTSSGFVQVQTMRADRHLHVFRIPRHASNKHLRGVPIGPEAAADVAEAFSSIAGYAGRFDIDPTRRVVLHHVMTAVDPNMVGGVQERSYNFTEDGRLELGIAPYEALGMKLTDVLKWERLDSEAPHLGG